MVDAKSGPGGGFATSRGSPPLETAGRQFSEATDSLTASWIAAQKYLSAQAARLRLALRTVVLLSIVGAIVGIFSATILVYSAVLMMSGIANGVALVLGGRQWAGDLITGAGVVLVIFLVVYIVVAKVSKASRRRTVSQYQQKV